ncbi:MAG: hypothetical protein HQM16_11125 [Deltaproteobacteria bacterium]|nr:hypothetical protein [Deltaproteobacteria bacterium]
MDKKQLFEHGESGQGESCSPKKAREVTEHLRRLWQLLPKADVDKIIKPFTSLHDFVVYQECLSMFEDADGAERDFADSLEGVDTVLIQ